MAQESPDQHTHYLDLSEELIEIGKFVYDISWSIGTGLVLDHGDRIIIPRNVSVGNAMGSILSKTIRSNFDALGLDAIPHASIPKVAQLINQEIAPEPIEGTNEDTKIVPRVPIEFEGHLTPAEPKTWPKPIHTSIKVAKQLDQLYGSRSQYVLFISEEEGEEWFFIETHHLTPEGIVKQECAIRWRLNKLSGDHTRRFVRTILDALAGRCDLRFETIRTRLYPTRYDGKVHNTLQGFFRDVNKKLGGILTDFLEDDGSGGFTIKKHIPYCWLIPPHRETIFLAPSELSPQNTKGISSSSSNEVGGARSRS